MATSTLADLLAALLTAETLRQKAENALQKADGAGLPAVGSQATYHRMVGHQLAALARESHQHALAHANADRLATVCIAETGRFTSDDLRKLCAKLALDRGRTLNDVLKMTSAEVADLLETQTQKPVGVARATSFEGKPTPPPAEMNPESRAIMLVRDEMKAGHLPTQEAIAETLDVTTRTLRNWKAFQAAYQNAKRAQQRSKPRGKKGKDGSLESW